MYMLWKNYVSSGFVLVMCSVAIPYPRHTYAKALLILTAVTRTSSFQPLLSEILCIVYEELRRNL